MPITMNWIQEQTYMALKDYKTVWDETKFLG